MKKIVIFSLAFVFTLSATVVSAHERDPGPIDNTREEKTRGMPPEQWEKLEVVLQSTPRGDEVVRILRKKLPN
jgi:hypothetical protein